MPDIAPDEPLAIIGDVHGRADLLRKSLSQTTVKTALVGDYIDRGEDSAEVLRLLQPRGDLVCIAGNHEDMLLKFLDNPANYGPRWLQFGGLQTLASFGIMGATQTTAAAKLEETRDRLLDAMGPNLVDWLRALPSFWQSGNVVIAHAGADPGLAMNDQDDQVLRWGHKDFATTRRTDGLWVVHGHTIVEEPGIDSGRVSTDTGAYATGRLTTALISSDGVTFQTTT